MTARELLERKRKAGLSDLQALALLVLAEKALLCLTDLADEMQVGPSAAWHAVKKLELAGLIEKSEGDRSSVLALIYLTADGQKVLAGLLRGKQAKR